MPLKTKIIATISNHDCSPAFINRLYRAGMNIVRLNTAHMTHEDALKVISCTREVSNKIGILLDTKGPEIRTCNSSEPLYVKYGDYVHVKGAPNESSIDDLICVSYDRFVNDVPVGSSILIDDGHITLTVMEKTDEFLTCFVENDGEIQGNKSINIPSVHVKLPALSQKDIGFIEFAAEQDLDFIAHSFVRNKGDVLAVQEILDRKKSPIKIIAKIENAEGVENLNEILEHAYGVMIARGDLAAEIPTEKIPLIQKQMIQRCIVERKPVIVATQMLHSMIKSPRPTRAEVSDVANACIDGADALMLSGETAHGKYPDLAVRTMVKVAKEVEDTRSSFIDVPYTADNKTTAYLAKAAVKAAFRLDTCAIVADSMSGTTILELAAFRGDHMIYAQVYDPRVMRRLSLSFGVHANLIERNSESSAEPLKKAIQRLVQENHFQKSSKIIVLAGSFDVEHGASYIEISTAENLMNKSG